MHNAKQIALQAKDLLTVCLAKAIDTALTEKLGEHWFTEFCREDAQDPKYAIVNKGQNGTGDMDLQALLKILRRRERFAEQVLQYYGFINRDDPFAQDTRRQQLQGSPGRRSCQTPPWSCGG